MTPREDAAITLALFVCLSLAFVGLCIAVRAGAYKMRRRSASGAWPDETCTNRRCALHNANPRTDR